MALQLYVQPRAGELIGQGIMQAAQAMSEGMDKYYKRQEQKKQKEAFTKYMTGGIMQDPGAQRMLNMATPDEGAAKAAAESLWDAAGGNIQQAMTMLQGLQQVRERQEAMELERKQRFAQQDLLDPAMRVANRLDAPEQYGRQIDSNTYLRDAMRMGLPVRDSAAVAGVMNDTEIAGLRAEAAAAKANRPAHTPRVVQVTGPDGKPVRMAEISSGNFQVLADDKAEPGLRKGERRTVDVPGVGKIDAEWDGNEWRDIATGAPIYTREDPLNPELGITTRVNPAVSNRYGGTLTLKDGWTQVK